MTAFLSKDNTKRINYDKFGNKVLNVGSLIIDLAYVGGLYDEDTKLTRFGARDYESAVGRWTSKDPIGFNGGVSNLYEYCVNNPINYIDPNGLQVAKNNDYVSPEEYRESLRKLIFLYQQLIYCQEIRERAKRIEEALAKYKWQMPIFWEGVDLAMSTFFDTMAGVATVAQAYPMAAGFTIASYLWTGKNEGFDSEAANVALAFGVAGTFGSSWVQGSAATGQIIYDLFR